jgi:hypothetical protein
MLTMKARQWKDDLTSARPTTAPTEAPLGSTPGARLGGEIELTHVQPAPRKVIEITGLDELFALTD